MSDFLFGVIGLILFLAVGLVGGYVLYRFKNRQLTNAWEPLVALVNGKVVGDGGGGATSWLSGTYKGRPVVASLSPNINQHQEGGFRYNYFDVALGETPGQHDWNIEYTRSVLGVGKTGWRVRSRDAALETALIAAGVADLVAPFGETPSHFMRPTLEYNRHERLLRYRTDITPRVAPTPDQFTRLLDLLLQLAEVNARVNPARA